MEAVTIHGLAVEAPVVELVRWLLLLPVLPLLPHQHGPRGLPGSVACCLRGHSVASLLAPVSARRLALGLSLLGIGRENSSHGLFTRRISESILAWETPVRKRVKKPKRPSLQLGLLLRGD